MPGLLLFSLRVLIEALLAPLRAARRLFGGERQAAEPEPPAPVEPVAPQPAPPPPRRRRAPARPRRAEPTRGQVARRREAAREAEVGGADSIGAQVHVAEPWPGYDAMRLDEVLGRLGAATEVERALVVAYEREHEARQAVLLAAGESA